MSLKSVPSQGPLRVVLIMCPTCGQVVLPTLTKARHGVSQIVFYHTNKEMGCAWKSQSSMERATGETLGLKESVRMGNDAKGQPLMVNEYELAEDKSFDVEGLRPFAMFEVTRAEAPVNAVPQLTERTTEPAPTTVPVPAKPLKFAGPTGAIRSPDYTPPAPEDTSGSIGDPVPAGTASE